MQEMYQVLNYISHRLIKGGELNNDPPSPKKGIINISIATLLKKIRIFIIHAVLFSHNLKSNYNQCVSFITSHFTFWVDYLTKEVVIASISLSQIRKVCITILQMKGMWGYDLAFKMCTIV